MKKIFVLVSVVLFLAVLSVQPVQANVKGCTPGFWKNHVDLWYNYAPQMTLRMVFERYETGNEWYWPVELDDLADKTLLQALKFKGGKGIYGAARIMLRQAAAALLNAAHPQVSFFSEEYVKMLVRWGLHYTNERDNMIWLSTFFTYWNELGSPFCSDDGN